MKKCQMLLKKVSSIILTAALVFTTVFYTFPQVILAEETVELNEYESEAEASDDASIESDDASSGTEETYDSSAQQEDSETAEEQQTSDADDETEDAENGTEDTEDAEAAQSNVSEETGVSKAMDAAEEETADEAADDSEDIEKASEEASSEISTLSVSINATDITLYGLDTWEDAYISIPDDYLQSFTIKVTGASSVSYSVISGDSVTVSSSGVITPAYWYTYHVDDSYLSTKTYYEDYELISKSAEYGTTTIQVTADSVIYTVTVEYVDYGDVYADEVMDSFLEENITDSMTNLEKVTEITRYVAETYDYSYGYSSAKGMIISGGGDCWASTNLIVALCEKIGMEAWSRDASQDSGAGSSHRNAMVADPDEEDVYYICEAGYTGTAPRGYYVETRTSLFCYKTVDGGIEVYQYDGSGYGDYSLTIPSEIDGYTVVGIAEDFAYSMKWKTVILPDTITYIGECAFYYCSYLTSINIPAGVTSIGTNAFGGCTSLTEFDVNEENTVYQSIDGVLYDADAATLLIYPAGRTDSSYTVPAGVTAIDDGAFTGSKNLVSVEIADTVTSIGTNAFYYCEALTNVSFSDSLTEIGDGAFYNCTALSSVSLPDSLSLIGDWAFAYCEVMTSVDLGEGVTSIGDYAFYRCYDLMQITVPASVVSIGEWTFGSYYSGEVDARIIVFEGDVPTFGEDPFYKLDVTVYYPCGNETWTSDVLSEDYGANSISWYEKHSYETGGLTISGSEASGACTSCGESTTYELTIELSETSYVYDGSAKEPAVTIIMNGAALTEGTDYTVSYSDNTASGTATATITGIGIYSGIISKTFTITRQSLSSSGVTLSFTSKTYTGSAFSPTITVKNAAGTTLTKNTDYTLSTPSGRTNAGTYTYTVTGIGNYTGTVEKTLTINAVSIKTSSSAYVSCVLSKTSYTYSGSKKTPSVTLKVKVNGTTKTLKSGTNYTVTYSSSARKAIGKYTVTIKGKGNFTGTITKTFKILPKKGTISSLKSSSKKKMIVKWKTVSGSVTKYQVRYRVKGTSKWTTKTYSSSAKSKTISGLKSGKTYQVQVRAYKTVGGTKYYGSWSSTKTVKVK